MCVNRSTDKKSGRQTSSGRPMARCSVVQVLLSQVSGAMPIVPRLKQKGRKAEDQRRPDGRVHSTAAAGDNPNEGQIQPDNQQLCPYATSLMPLEQNVQWQ